MRLQIVINPSAGGGRAAKLLPAALIALAEHDVVVTPTVSLEHADSLVAEAISADRVVVAMGGDGIVGRVAGVVADLDGVMGLLPGGRGNDFARVVGIPRDITAACAALSTAVERRVDLGMVGEVAFLGIASIGFDSEVQERVLSSRLPLGQLVYLYGSLITVARWRHASFTCSVDGVSAPVHGWSFAVANSGMYGGGMHLAPMASVHDGLLDIVSTSATSRRRFLATLPKLFKGTHITAAEVSVSRGRSVHLDADRPFRVFADGDPVGTLPATVTVRPGALRCLLPA